MAGGNSDNGDGSEIFWPGYVDATTNLILNLLFLVTILIVAVFMFALELGRAIGPQDANADHKEKIEQVAEIDPLEENIALKKEIERLTVLLEKAKEAGAAAHQARALQGSSIIPKPDSGLEQALAGDFDLMVRFKDEAVSFSESEQQQLLIELRPIAENEKALILVQVPAGFSEARRMGFYRALAVRNLLIELNMQTENIDVSVVEGTSGADASVVKVKSR